jgi:tryptophanyl-tRNA synthetase
MKQLLFEHINTEISKMRAEYQRLSANPDHVEEILKAGAAKAREISVPYLAEIRERVGVRPVG